MKLLDVLACGVQGASQGTVDIFVRATSTRAQVFTDYDGSGAQTPTGALPLDSNGGAVWYVNQPVFCQVRDSNGDIVREFTAFETATDVEVISPSFTGVNYQTGVSSTFNPTVLSTVLDRWFTSAGASDWNVLVRGFAGIGTVRSIQAAISAVSGLFFNVKDPAYGALGDGVTDDRAAVQGAIVAADAVGGIVFFPPGTYLIGNPGIAVNGTAELWGSNSVLITSTFAGGNLLTISSGSNNKFAIRRIRLSCTSATQRLVLLSAGACSLTLEDVLLTTGSLSTVAAMTLLATGNVLLLNTFLTYSGTGTSVTAVSATGTVIAINSDWASTMSADANIALLQLLNGGVVIGCRFSAANAAPLTYIQYATAGSQCVVLGTSFGSSPFTTIAAIAINNAGLPVFEYGNTFGTSVTPISNVAFGADSTRVSGQYASVEHNSFFATNDGGAVTLTNVYGHWRIRRTTAGAQTITLPNPQTAAQEGQLTIINDGGGAPVTTLSTIKGLASVTPAAGTRQTISMKSEVVGGTSVWVLVSNTNWT